jgi:pimeloyl-ACP methyl ester carboxylesterase
MTTFVLIPGAGGVGVYWHPLVTELEARGHRGVAVDIPEDELDLWGYAETVEAAMDGHDDTVLVAQSLGGFTAPMIRKPVQMIVLLNPMIPLPGERPDDWWANTDSESARRAANEAAGIDPAFDLDRLFFHDLSPQARALLLSRPAREPSAAAMAQPCAFDRWPDVPTKVVVGRDDRFFPAAFQRRVAKQRLGVDADEIPGGHLAAMSNPAGLADLLTEYVAS